MSKSAKAPGFYITGKKGFHITFANGYTVSVQFGPGNYCDNYDRDIGRDEEASGRDGSRTAEIAAWGPGGSLQTWEGWDDSVKGHVTPDEVLAFMNTIAAMPAPSHAVAET